MDKPVGGLVMVLEDKRVIAESTEGLDRGSVLLFLLFCGLAAVYWSLL